MKIGAELGEPPWRVYKLWAEGRLQGVWKDGRDLFASKRALRRAHHNRARTGKTDSPSRARCQRALVAMNFNNCWLAVAGAP